RGFTDLVWATDVASFLGQAPALFAAAPISRLRLGACDRAGMQELVASSAFARIRSLNLTNRAGPESLDLLLESPAAAGLTELILDANDLGSELAELLAGSPHLGRLVHLGLAENDLGEAGVRALGLGCFPALQRLGLRGNGLDARALRALAEAPCLAGLTDLD